MLLDARYKILSASDDAGLLAEHYMLEPAQECGDYAKKNRLNAYAVTPDYEIYKNLVWYGAIKARPDDNFTD